MNVPSQPTASAALRFPPTDDYETSLRTGRIVAVSKPQSSSPVSAVGPTPAKRKPGRPKGAKPAGKWSRITTKDVTSSENDEEEGTMSTTSAKGKGRAVEDPTPTDEPSGQSSRSNEANDRTTKSGRRVKKPSAFTPDTAPTFHRKPKRKPVAPPPSVNPMAGTYTVSGCVLCSMDHSTAGNQIVLCDDCDRSFHQQCHQPGISDDLLSDVHAQWFCSACAENVVATCPAVSWEELVSGQGFSTADKNDYLASLPRHALGQMLRMVSEHYPEARLYPPSLTDVMQARRGKQPRPASAVEIDSDRPNADGDVQRSLDASNGGFGAPRVAWEQGSADLSPGTAKETAGTARFTASHAAKTSKGTMSPSKIVIASNLPSYEDMIVNALVYINEPNGSPPRMIFEWMNDTYPLLDNFRPSAHQALQKAAKRGRLLKDNNLYKINPKFDEKTNPRRPTRRPKKGTQHTALSSKHIFKQKPPTAYATPLDPVAARQASGSLSATPSEADLQDTADDQDMLDEELPHIGTSRSARYPHTRPAGVESEELGDEQDYQLEGDAEGEVGEGEEDDEIDGEIEHPASTLLPENKEGMDAMLADLFRHSGQAAMPSFPAPHLPLSQNATVYQPFPQFHSVPASQPSMLSDQLQQFFQNHYAQPTPAYDTSINYSFGDVNLQPRTTHLLQPSSYNSNLDPSLPGVRDGS